jgi:hypothetical protein
MKEVIFFLLASILASIQLILAVFIIAGFKIALESLVRRFKK